MSEFDFNHGHKKRQELANNIANSYQQQASTTPEIQKGEESTEFDFNHAHNHRSLLKSQIHDSFVQEETTTGSISKSEEDELEKGGKRAVIGEKRTFGGREYIKTSSGWKFHGKGTGAKAQEHAKSSLDHHVNSKKESEMSAEDHPKGASKPAEEKKEETQKFSSDVVSKYKALKDENQKAKEATKKALNEKKSPEVMRELAAVNTRTANKLSAMEKKYPGISTYSTEEAKPSAGKHIGDMSATEKKALATKLGISTEGKTTKQVDKAITDAMVDKQLADFKASKKSSDREHQDGDMYEVDREGGEKSTSSSESAITSAYKKDYEEALEKEKGRAGKGLADAKQRTEQYKKLHLKDLKQQLKAAQQKPLFQQDKAKVSALKQEIENLGKVDSSSSKDDRGAKTITKDTPFKEGDEVEVKENLYYVKKESGLISESELENEGYHKGGEGVSLYLKKGTKMKSMEDGNFDEVTFEGGGCETGLDLSWIKDN